MMMIKSSRQLGVTTRTHLKGLVENTQAPCALPPTFDNLHTELVLGVGLEVVDINIQIGRVDHSVSSAGRIAARLISDCVESVVVASLAASEAWVSPHHDYSSR